RARVEQRLPARVGPADEVRWPAVGAARGDHFAVAVVAPQPGRVDDDPVSRCCRHRCPPFSRSARKASLLVLDLGAVVRGRAEQQGGQVTQCGGRRQLLPDLRHVPVRGVEPCPAEALEPVAGRRRQYGMRRRDLLLRADVVAREQVDRHLPCVSHRRPLLSGGHYGPPPRRFCHGSKGPTSPVPASRKSRTVRVHVAGSVCSPPVWSAPGTVHTVTLSGAARWMSAAACCSSGTVPATTSSTGRGAAAAAALRKVGGTLAGLSTSATAVVTWCSPSVRAPRRPWTSESQCRSCACRPVTPSATTARMRSSAPAAPIACSPPMESPTTAIRPASTSARPAR